MQTSIGAMFRATFNTSETLPLGDDGPDRSRSDRGFKRRRQASRFRTVAKRCHGFARHFATEGDHTIRGCDDGVLRPCTQIQTAMNNTYPQMPGVSRHDMPKRHRTWHTMGRMSDNTTQRKALQQLESEPSEERIAYYRKPFMVLWAAIQEASSELQDDYTLSPELSQLWVGEQIRQVSDSLVDRLAEIAVAHGESKSNVARAANASPDNVIRRFPRLKADAAHDRTLIDDVLDSLE